MAQGDYTVSSTTLTSATVSFQPSAGVSVVVKTCTAEYQSTSNYINLETSGGADLGYLTGASGALRVGDWLMGTLYFNCTIFMDNSSYLQFDGTGSAAKGYTVAYIQISE